MSTPTAICLNTEVFERLNFNFAATTLQELVKLCKERKVKFSADDKDLVSCDHVEIDTYDFELSRTPRWL